MLSVNQEIPEELVQTDSALLCPLLAGQMSVSHTAPLLGVLFVITFLSAKIHSVLLGAPHPKSYWTFCITGKYTGLSLFFYNYIMFLTNSAVQRIRIKVPFGIVT